ncbi:hypothetical protein IXB28_02715 [Leptothoe kymatousa TAU-MAC 1615]|uniref:Uncharacterized protein n=2 Tax=Leptothoe TaxID=2651725 RepID=A0ABS5XZV4_9CYAN|nr:hypothetical protein [Leptothoe kymatousa TAU-MAC 1615]
MIYKIMLQPSNALLFYKALGKSLGGKPNRINTTLKDQQIGGGVSTPMSDEVGGFGFSTAS